MPKPPITFSNAPIGFSEVPDYVFKRPDWILPSRLPPFQLLIFDRENAFRGKGGATIWYNVRMAKYDPGLREEELKLKVAADWFAAFDTEKIVSSFQRPAESVLI